MNRVPYAGCRIFILFTLLISFLADSFSQDGIPHGNNLNGEDIVPGPVSTTIPVLHHRITTKFLATGSGVYKDGSPPGSFYPHYQRIFGAPKGRTIKALGMKRTPPPEEKEYVVILLDNGDYHMYQYTLIDTWKFIDSGHIGGAGSDSWEKILGDALYALSSTSIFVTHDGNNWQKDTLGLGTVTVNHFDLDTAIAMIYAATHTGLYRKDTLPPTAWSKVTSFTGSFYVGHVFIDRLNRIRITGNNAGLWKSTDLGTSWQVDTVGLGPNGTLHVFGDDSFGNLYGANNTTKRIYRSTNGNQPWQQIDNDIINLSGYMPTIRSVGGDTVIHLGSTVGMFRSIDQGNTWNKSDSGIVSESFYGLARLSNGKVYAATSMGVYLNNPGDSAWSKSYPQNGYSGQVAVYANNSGVLYGRDNNIPHTTTPIPIVKSIDQGLNWTMDTVGLSAINGNLFYIDETGTQHYCNTIFSNSIQCKLWKRSPPGAWTEDTDGFPVAINSVANSMASDRNGYLYVSGTFSGKKVMRRPIAGGTWAIDSIGLGTVARFIQMTPGYNGDVIGITNTSRLMRRSTGSWTEFPRPPEMVAIAPIINALAVDSAGNIFVAFSKSGLGKGVFYTKNYGVTWTLAGLDSIRVSQLIAYNDIVYALTIGNGAYQLTAAPASPMSSTIPPTIDSVAITYTPLSNVSGVPSAPYFTNYPPAAGTTATIYRGDRMELSLKVANGGNSYNIGVWADFNGNNLFEPAENILLTARTPEVGSSWLQVPVSVSTLNVKLRIRVSTNTITSGDCCNSLSNGETEDYTLSVSQVLNCRWTGRISTDWHDPANWSCGAVPDPTKSVMIPSGTPFNCIITSSDVTVDRIWIHTGANVTVVAGRNLNVNGNNLLNSW